MPRPRHPLRLDRPMKPDEMMGMTGMAMGKKRTRRGKRRGKGPHAEHLQHMAEMKRCVECQDHKGAKNAAFKFIKALPADEAEMEHGMMEEKGEMKMPIKPEMKAKGKLSPGLAAFLARKKAK